MNHEEAGEFLYCLVVSFACSYNNFAPQRRWQLLFLFRDNF